MKNVLHWSTKYLGKPWHPVTLNCWSLVQHVYRNELEMDIADMDVNARVMRDVLRGFRDSSEFTNWVRVPSVMDSLEYDVALMSSTERPSHVGVVVAGSSAFRVLHITPSYGSVIEDLGSLRISGFKILGIYRRRSLHTAGAGS